MYCSSGQVKGSKVTPNIIKTNHLFYVRTYLEINLLVKL